MNVVDLVGFAGAAVVLVAFGLASSRSSDVRPRALAAMNLAAGPLAMNGAVHHAWPSTVLNATWFVIAVVALCRPSGARSPAPRDERR